MSDFDFDSTVAGEQKLAADANVSLNFITLGSGDDTLQIVRGADGAGGSGDVNARINTGFGGAVSDTLVIDDSARTTANTFDFLRFELTGESFPSGLAEVSHRLVGDGYSIGLGAGTDGRVFLTTGAGGDDVRGGDGGDVLRGQDRNDLQFGGAGNDDVRGGDGLDFADGGSGDDFIINVEASR